MSQRLSNTVWGLLREEIWKTEEAKGVGQVAVAATASTTTAANHVISK